MTDIIILFPDAVFARMLSLVTGDAFSVNVLSSCPKNLSCRLLITDIDGNIPHSSVKYDCLLGITKKAESEDDEKYDFVFHRPFSERDFRDKVNELLSAEKSDGEIISDTQTKEQPRLVLKNNNAFYGEKSVLLSPTEAVLLSFLQRAGNETVQTEQLIDLLGENGSKNTLAVMICRIREKLSLLSPYPFIKSVRGSGYRLI